MEPLKIVRFFLPTIYYTCRAKDNGIGIDDLDPKLQIGKLALRANPACCLWIWYLEMMILNEDYRFGQIWSQNWKLNFDTQN